MRHPKDDGCEYSDAQGRSRTKVLEETIASLEARLHELENPSESTPSVTLHDPYRAYHEGQQRNSPIVAESSRMAMEASLLSPLTTTFDSPSITSQNSPANIPYFLPSSSSPFSGSSGRSSSASSPYQGAAVFLGHDEPPITVIQTLVDAFLRDASDFGFFLHAARFRHDVLRPLPFGQPPRPSPGLLSAVYLWGVHLAQLDPLIAYEEIFLSRALQNTATDLTGSHRHRVLHTIQAHVLLAYYFWRNGRILEAKTHSASAVSLAVGCNLHRWRSARPAPDPGIGVVVESSDGHVPPPRDPIEEGEIINAFWAVFVLHTSLAAAVDPPSNLCGVLEAPGMEIDTPWPLDMEGYRDGLLTPDTRGSLTVRKFLSPAAEPKEHLSNVSMVAKAVILFHRASYLSGRIPSDPQAREFQVFMAGFQSLDQHVSEFKSQLAPLPQPLVGDKKATRHLMFAHTLVNAATIKLHSIFSFSDTNSQAQCMAAARSIVNDAQSDLGFVHPLMGSLWVTACQVFINEISKRRTIHGVVEGEESMWSGLRAGLAAMTAYSAASQLMRAFSGYIHRLGFV
ncbi:hypothetical protein HGRIS_003125 [Hohenbuehelia grisea]|uniref:Transcription factor domain-containing protein n=1 Tax=Hohenbuehelia grisea TaxID=104357 RepID=A0ABR3JN28_9AGAR